MYPIQSTFLLSLLGTLLWLAGLWLADRPTEKVDRGLVLATYRANVPLAGGGRGTRLEAASVISYILEMIRCQRFVRRRRPPP